MLFSILVVIFFKHNNQEIHTMIICVNEFKS